MHLTRLYDVFFLSFCFFSVSLDLCRRHGSSEATFYNWKAKLGGMEVSEAKKLRALEAENAKLKKLLAEAELDKAMLKEVLSKKW